jgi:hypothetical protein
MTFAQVQKPVRSMLDLNNETIAAAVSAAKTMFSGINASAKTPISLLQGADQSSSPPS